jgi:hypothetical protein
MVGVCLVALYTFGNAGAYITDADSRSALTSPSRRNSHSRKHTIEFRTNIPSGQLCRSDRDEQCNFGRITSQRVPPRQIQFGLRYGSKHLSRSCLGCLGGNPGTSAITTRLRLISSSGTVACSPSHHAVHCLSSGCMRLPPGFFSKRGERPPSQNGGAPIRTSGWADPGYCCATRAASLRLKYTRWCRTAC